MHRPVRVRRASAPTAVAHDLVVDGSARRVVCPPATSLLAVLREHLAVRSVKEACGSGECGTCTVLVGDAPVLACVTMVGLVDDAVHTADGIADRTRDLRGAMADEGAFQCGFCTPGQVVTGAAVVAMLQGTSATGPAEDRAVLRDEVAHLMSGVLCRCTGSIPIVDVVTDVVRRGPGGGR
jgi:aerobic-type carbon monoxide dehydrogenase small subunit (CoxS/CutS family)